MIEHGAIDAQLGQPSAQGLSNCNTGLPSPSCVMPMRWKPDRMAHAAADRLGERLLGGEAFRQQAGLAGRMPGIRSSRSLRMRTAKRSP